MTYTNALRLGLLCLGLLALPWNAEASIVTISSSTPQSGFSGYSYPSYPLTGGAYSFSSQDVGSLGSITSISVTLSIGDGDSAMGDFDFGDLTLGLDGIDTGIRLDGFANDDYEPNQPVTLTITGTPQNADAILAALQDGQLMGSIIDHDDETGTGTGDNLLQILDRNDTTLSLTGQFVPEPTSFVVLGIGTLGLVGYTWRKRRTV